jgi:hypothetical protein
MEPYVAAMCAMPPEYAKGNPHAPKFITVFVNNIGEKAMLATDSTTIPVGSIIVKEKFDSDTDGKLELLTIMVKREKGFDPTVGDWEFLTASGERNVHQGVDVSHCISCHRGQPETDFVFRSYLPQDK